MATLQNLARLLVVFSLTLAYLLYVGKALGKLKGKSILQKVVYYFCWVILQKIPEDQIGIAVSQEFQNSFRVPSVVLCSPHVKDLVDS